VKIRQNILQIIIGSVVGLLGLRYLLRKEKAKVLFLCTGNYYRSRVAEELFNYLVSKKGLHYFAISRGLANDVNQVGNVGAIAPYAIENLKKMGVPTNKRYSSPENLVEKDFLTAKLIIALNKIEHAPLIRKKHPYLNKDIVYWDIPDVDKLPAEDACKIIEKKVLELVSTLDNKVP